ncbi:MAG: type II secretion system F family protein, partial [Actinomycetota bacterium]
MATASKTRQPIMAFQDWFRTGESMSGVLSRFWSDENGTVPLPRTSSKTQKIALNDLEQMIRIGEITGQMPLVLSQISKQLLDFPRPRRRVSGILMYPLILIGISVFSAFAIPRML